MATCPYCHAPGHTEATPCRVCGRVAPARTDYAPGDATIVFSRPAGPAAVSPPPPAPTPTPTNAATVSDTPHPPPRPRLVVLRGEEPGMIFPLLPGRNYLGRSGDKPVDIDLSGQEPVERTWTSRQHACVTLEGGMLILEDLVSLNGTFLNRVRLHPGQPKPIQPGDVVQVGTVQMRVEIG